MPVLKIVTIPDPVLRAMASPVDGVDADLRRLVADMFETMYAAPGVGLAAPQVGVSRRVIVMDPSRGEEPKHPLAMINPEIVAASETVRPHEEGCLSIPDMFADVERPEAVTVRYLDPDGRPQERLCEGFLAIIVQHEIDHLNGVLFIDHLSRLRRELLIKRFYKARRDGAATA